MPTPSRRKPAPQAPAILRGDLDAPTLRVNMKGLFPDLYAVGEHWSVDLTNQWTSFQARAREGRAFDAEIGPMFVAAFLADNPEFDEESLLQKYPPVAQLRALAAFFQWRLANFLPTVEEIPPGAMLARRHVG